MEDHLEHISSEQYELMKQHLSAVVKKNDQVNLTRIVSLDQGELLHIRDSLAALPEMERAPQGRYGDLGSGGGFPGIPLAIATGRETLLIDARQKKMIAVQEIIDELGLQDQIHTFAGRAELLAQKQPESFAVLTARALAKLSVLLELASPLLQKDGQLICYKANVEDDELEAAQHVHKETGMSLVSQRKFMLDDNTRTILVFAKNDVPQMKLPRSEGAAQKHPL